MYPWDSTEEQRQTSNVMQAMTVDDATAEYDDDYDIGVFDRLAISVKAGLYGMANNFMQIGNAFGGDNELYDIGEELDSEGDQGEYYRQHKVGFDLAGDVITSFIPGTMAFKAIKLAKAGALGARAMRGSTYFQNKGAKVADEISELYSQHSTAAKAGSLKRKVYGYNTLQEAMEGAVIGVATEASLNLGDIINNDGLTAMEKVGQFSTSAILWGAVIPAPLISTFTYHATMAGAKNVLRETVSEATAFHPDLNQIRAHDGATGEMHGNDVLHTLSDYKRISELDGGDKEFLLSAQQQSLTTLEAKLSEQITKLMPDSTPTGSGSTNASQGIEDLRNFMKDSLKTEEGRQVIANFVTESSVFKPVSTYQVGMKASMNKVYDDLVPEYRTASDMKTFGDNNYHIETVDGKRKLLVNEDYANDLNVRLQAATHYHLGEFSNKLNSTKKKWRGLGDEVRAINVEHFLPDATDQFDTLQKAFELFSARSTKFMETSPKLVKYFKKLGADEAKILYGNTEVKYLDVVGGGITTNPMTHLGDMKGYRADGMHNRQVSYDNGTKVSNIEFDSVARLNTTDDLLEYQARRLLASNGGKLIGKESKLDELNLAEVYRLERMILNEMKDADVKGVSERLVVSRGKEPNSFNLIDSIKTVVHSKMTEANRLLDSAQATGTTLDDVANTLGVSPEFIQGRGVITDDIIKDMMNPNSTRSLDEVMIDSTKLGERRTYASIQDLGSPRSSAEDGYVAFSESQRASQSEELRNSVEEIMGMNFRKTLPEIALSYITDNLNLRRFYQDAATVGHHMGIEAKTARVGDWVAKQSNQVFEEAILPRLSQVSTTLSNSQPAMAEIIAFNHWYSTRPEKYFQLEEGLWVSDAMEKIVADRLKSGEEVAGVMGSLRQGEHFYQLKNPESIGYVDTIQTLNREFINGRKSKFESAYGNDTSKTNSRYLYLPPSDFKHVTYIRVNAGSPLDNHSSTMMRVTGQNQEDLATKVGEAMKYGREHGWEKIERTEIMKYANAKSMFEWGGQDLRGSSVNSKLQRSSNTPEMFPKVDPSKLVTEHANWFKNQNRAVHQTAVEMHYSDLISNLNYQIGREQGGIRSHIDEVPGIIKSSGESTAEKFKPGNHQVILNQLLGIDDSGFSTWKVMNNTLETWGAKMFTPIARQVRNMRKKNEPITEWGEHIDKVEAELKENGIGTPIKTVLLEQLKNEQALDGKDVVHIASQLNFFQSLLLLRMDQADSLVNTLGYAVKAGSEITALNQMVARSGTAVQNNYDLTVRELFGVANTPTASGTNIGVYGIGKALAVATKEMFTDVGKANIARWKEMHLLSDADAIQRELFQELTIKPNDLITRPSVSAFKDRISNAGNKALKASTFLNDKSNILSQYSSLMIAEKLGKAAGLVDAELSQFMFSFNRRTNVLSTPTQKPRLFQGVAGVALSLYQSYMFHTLANLYRYAEQGANKAPLAFMALNTTFFGAKGVPGFEYINHQVGMSNSDKGNVDLYGAAHTALDDDVANFLLYGAGSTLLQTNIHTRGDLTPRSPILLPTSLPEIPIASAMIKTIGSVYDNSSRFMMGTQSFGQTIWNTVADTGLSRPLTGLAAIARGKSVDSRHATVMFHNDVVDMTTPMRVAGLKPFTEQFVRDYQFRNMRYKLANNKRKVNLGKDLRLMYSNDASQFNDAGFMSRLAHKYSKSGGSIDQFDTWVADSLIKADNDLSVRIEDDLGSNESALDQYKLFMQGGD